MKNVHVAVLATLFGISAASGIALTQAQHPGNNSGLLAATASMASADENDHGEGRGKHNRNGSRQNGPCNDNNGNWQSGQRNGDDENDNEQGNQNNQGNGNRGKHRGWQNPNNPHNCANNGGWNGQKGNSTLRGTITSVNGNQVTLMAGFGNVVTINDQPALNNQQTGRVVVGRYVTAYGYYQNGIFYATSLQ